MSKYLESHVSAYVINSWHFQNFTIPGLKKTVITKYEEENKNNHPNIFFCLPDKWFHFFIFLFLVKPKQWPARDCFNWLRHTDALIGSDIFSPSIPFNARGISAVGISLVNTNSISATSWSSQVNISDQCQTVTRENSLRRKIWLIPRALSFGEECLCLKESQLKQRVWNARVDFVGSLGGFSHNTVCIYTADIRIRKATYCLQQVKQRNTT